jgi:CubicO group peptidase (beta-lactamase class C family)
MFKRSLLALSLVITLASVPASFAIQEQHPDFSQLERVILEELKETNTPGAVVAIVSGERAIYTKAFGISNIATGAPMTPDMLFRIGSATQMFTATALVTLAEEGKLKLDEAIGNHVAGLNPKIAGVTGHQLLTHTAGFIDEARSYEYHGDSALGRTSRSWVGAMLFAEPGKIISISRPGYSLAGFAVESIGKKPFADHMSESIFKPLGMASTTFSPTVAMTYPLAQGHFGWSKSKPRVVSPVADNSARWPADSMFTNVVDLSRFVIAFMNGGKLEGKQVLSPSVIAKLSTPQVSIPSRPDAKYAYGLMIRDYRGVRVIGNVEHGDSGSGYGSVIMMVPDHRFALIVLWNRVPNPSDKTAEKAMELMLPLKPREEDKRKQQLPMTAAEMANCTGKYSNLEILVKDGALFLKQGRNVIPIRKIGENLFSVTGLQFALVPGADGKPEYFHPLLRAEKRR